jgi:hypothetical protein
MQQMVASHLVEGTETVDVNKKYNDRLESLLEDLNKKVKKETGCDLNKVHDSDDIDAEIKRPKTFIEKFKALVSSKEKEVNTTSTEKVEKRNLWTRIKDTISKRS